MQLQVVENLIQHSDPDSLVPIAMTSCHFMEEANLSTISKESEHNYADNVQVMDKVHIPGASYLLIEFDSRFALILLSHILYIAAVVLLICERKH